MKLLQPDTRKAWRFICAGIAAALFALLCSHIGNSEKLGRLQWLALALIALSLPHLVAATLILDDDRRTEYAPIAGLVWFGMWTGLAAVAVTFAALDLGITITFVGSCVWVWFILRRL